MDARVRAAEERTLAERAWRAAKRPALGAAQRATYAEMARHHEAVALLCDLEADQQRPRLRLVKDPDD